MDILTDFGPSDDEAGKAVADEATLVIAELASLRSKAPLLIAALPAVNSTTCLSRLRERVEETKVIASSSTMA
ncbi:hypothetical protein LCGC14_2962480, partial [marine sediment metagenome]